MHSKIFSGIFGHFLLRSSIIQTLSGVLMLAILVPYYDYAARDLAAEQGLTVSSSTFSATSEALYEQNYAQIVEYCLNVMKSTSNVRFIVYSKRDGQELIIRNQQWSTNKKSLPFYKLKFPSSNARSNKSLYLLDYDGWGLGVSDYYNFSKPISVANKEWGVLTISFSTSAYLSSIQTFNRLIIIFTFMSFLLSLALFFFSSRRIRKQIDAFGWVAKNLSEGNLSVKAKESAIGEIGVLGKAINSMSARLKDNSAKIFQLAKIVEQTNDAFVLFDASRNLIFANEALKEVTGYPEDYFMGMSLVDFARILNLNLPDLLQELDLTITDKRISPCHDVVVERSDGTIINLEMRLEVINDVESNTRNLLVVLSNINARKVAEDEIKSLAFYDPLTRLPNRRLLLDRLNHALVSCGRSGKKGALLFVDLDNFKSLNDTLGHDTGDLLLQQIAERLGTCVREGDTVARLGGDEFVVMLENLSEHGIEAAAQTEVVGDKVMTTLNHIYQLGPHEFHSTPSIGITLFNGQDGKIDEVLKQADIAMYQAKTSGRNRMCFFDPQMQDSINARVLLESELHTAIDEQQFQLYYQIQVDNGGRPVGAEALIRWVHPVRGLVSPAQFIPLAEEIGLIIPIGKWVLETACAQLKAWQQGGLARNLSLSVNVSAKQFRQKDFVAQVQETVQRHAINPALLKLEITESMLFDNVDDTIATMNVLKKIGIKFSLDDFGTGYSSLQYLKLLPLDQLKIDQTFVRDLAASSSDNTIVRTIIAMAQSLNLEVIAEGVETSEQTQLILKMGCNHYQGYLFGQPLPIESFEALLKQAGSSFDPMSIH